MGLAEVTLEVIPGEALRDLLDLWDDYTLAYDSEHAGQLTPDHPLKPCLSENRAPGPLRGVLSSVTKYPAIFAILENPCSDIGFWDNYCSFYSYSFTSYERFCKRLHFFEGDAQSFETLRDALLSGATQEEILARGFDYYGCTTLRPTRSHVVGRTLIKFDRRVQTDDKGRDVWPYLKMAEECHIDLLNSRFCIEAAEFIQQDPNLGQCATASLWVTTRAMAKIFGTNQFRYGTITRQAVGGARRDLDVNTVYDPTDPQSGLSATEMRNALAATGANSFLVAPSPQESTRAAYGRMKHELYSFVESGYPVLLCLFHRETHEGHAVVAVGHALTSEVDVGTSVAACEIVESGGENDFEGKHRLTSGTVELYYAHDDAYGPFNKVEFLPPPEKNGRKLGKFCTSRKGVIQVELGRSRVPYVLSQILIPVPRGVNVSAMAPLKWLLEYFNTLEYCERLFKSGKHRIIWRSLLVRSAEFKQSLAKRQYSPKLQRWYANLHLPKYVWLYEASLITEDEFRAWNPTDPGRYVLGEFLFDASCPSSRVQPLTARIDGYYQHGDDIIRGLYSRDSDADFYGMFIPSALYQEEDA